MVREAKTPLKKSWKSNSKQKKYQKRPKHDEDELEMLEFVEEEDEEEQQIEVVAPRGQMSSCILSSEQNRIRENIAKTKLICKGQLFHLPIYLIQRPPIDLVTGRQPLEI